LLSLIAWVRYDRSNSLTIPKIVVTRRILNNLLLVGTQLL